MLIEMAPTSNGVRSGFIHCVNYAFAEDGEGSKYKYGINFRRGLKRLVHQQTGILYSYSVRQVLQSGQ